MQRIWKGSTTKKRRTEPYFFPSSFLSSFMPIVCSPPPVSLCDRFPSRSVIDCREWDATHHWISVCGIASRIREISKQKKIKKKEILLTGALLRPLSRRNCWIRNFRKVFSPWRHSPSVIVWTGKKKSKITYLMKFFSANVYRVQAVLA